MRRLLALTALIAVTGALVAIVMDARGGARTRADDVAAPARGGGESSAPAHRGSAATRGDGASPARGRAAPPRGRGTGGATTRGDAEDPPREGGAPPRDGSAAPSRRRPPAPRAARRHAPTPPVVWRSSLALGSPTRGRLVRGVKLPVRGAHFLTWDPVRKTTPNRWWRRYGTDELVRVLLRVARGYARAHPHAQRLLIGDLSRPRGGDFGRRFGPLGHVSHQNGLDADVYFPRRDRRERAPRSAAQVDRRLAQDLVNRFRRAGVRMLLAGAALRLRGTQPWPNHDDHLHVRL